MARKTEKPFTAHALRMSSIESRFLEGGEAMVGFGFRCWLSGYRGCEPSWQRCWSYYCEELGCARAQAAISALSSWVNTVRCHALREIELLPPECPSFCRDECLAVTLVAASEHRACPALQLCAHLLLGASDIAPALASAYRFNHVLAGCGVPFVTSLVGDPPLMH
jgi:hypothetical protein